MTSKRTVGVGFSVAPPDWPPDAFPPTPPGRHVTISVYNPPESRPVELVELGLHILNDQGQPLPKGRLPLKESPVVLQPSGMPRIFHFDAGRIRGLLESANISGPDAAAYARLVRGSDDKGGISELTSDTVLPLAYLQEPVQEQLEPYETGSDLRILQNQWQALRYSVEIDSAGTITIDLGNRTVASFCIPASTAATSLRIVSSGHVRELRLEIPAAPCPVDIAPGSLDPSGRVIVHLDHDDKPLNQSRLDAIRTWHLSLPERSSILVDAHAADLCLTASKLDIVDIASYSRLRLQRPTAKARTSEASEPQPATEEPEDNAQVEINRLTANERLGSVFKLAGTLAVNDLILKNGEATLDLHGALEIRRVIVSRRSNLLRSTPVSIEFSGTSDSTLNIDWLPPGSTVQSEIPLELGRRTQFSHYAIYPWWEEKGGDMVYPVDLTSSTADSGIWDLHEVSIVETDSVSIFSTADKVRIRSEDRVTKLVIKTGARVSNVSGDVMLSVEPGGEITGDRGNPARIYKLFECKGSRIEQVDVSCMIIADVESTKEATSFVPALTNLGVNNRGRPVDPETGARSPSVPNSIDRRWEQERFLWSLSKQVRELKCPATVVREVEYWHYVARRRALKRGRERSLLAVYSAVGYGRRCLRPIISFAAFCLGLATILMIVDWTTLVPGRPIGLDGWQSVLADRPLSEFLSLYTLLLREPLVLLRLLTDPAGAVDDTVWGGLTIAAARGLGVVILGFSLLAIRRLFTYPEDKSR